VKQMRWRSRNGKSAIHSRVLNAGDLVVATFVGLPSIRAGTILSQDGLRLEDVASGYWTLSVK
jgi:hypothetical protein